MNTCHGLRARQTSRSNSSGVRLIGSPSRVTEWPATSMARSPMVSASWSGVVEAADPGPDPGDELLGLERLDDVVVGPGLEADDHVDGVALGGEHHDRHAGLGADLLADVDAVLAGQHQVEQHQVGPVVAERRRGPGRRARRSGSRNPPGAARSSASRRGRRRRRRRGPAPWTPMSVPSVMPPILPASDPRVPARIARSVAVLVGLVGPGDGDAEVGGLVVGELGELARRGAPRCSRATSSSRCLGST